MALVVLLLPGVARGDEPAPAAALRPPVTQELPRPAGLKSEGKAMALSITGLALPALILLRAAHAENETMAWVGVGTLVVLPSAGHWYAGDADLVGLGMRGLSAAALVGTIVLADQLDDDDPPAEDEEDVDGFPTLTGLALFTGFVTAAGLLGAGALYGPMTVRRVVQRHNDALYLAPFAGQHSAGLSLGGTF